MSNKSSADSHGRGDSKIILIYGLCGPPIGGLIAYMMLLLYAARGEFWWTDLNENTLQVLASTLAGFFTFPLYGYLFGGVQALLTALLIKVLADSEGRFDYLTASIAATLVGGGVGLILSVGYFFSIGHAPVIAFAALGGIGVAASLVLRFLFRERFRRA